MVIAALLFEPGAPVAEVADELCGTGCLARAAGFPGLVITVYKYGV